VLLLALLATGLGGLRAPGAEAAFPYGESFQNATAPGFVLGGSASLTANGGGDAPGDGWLRLTPASNQQFGYAYNQTAFPSSQGISYEFDYAAWGGSGADGLAFVLFDGATSDNQFNAGVNGGALGYSKCPPQPGLSNAYLGLGFDVYGNFASTSICQQTGIGAGLYPNRITVRGGAPNYDYLTSVSANGGVGTGNRAGARRVSVTVLPKNGQTVLTASVRSPNGSVQQIANEMVLPNPPTTLKFGFTASTGGSTNNHEIRGMHVTKPTDLQVAVNADETSADRDAVQGYTATVTNAGPNPVTGVDVTASMPNTDDIEWTCTASGGATCAFASGLGLPADDVGPLPVGGTLTYRITGTLTAAADDSKLTFAAEPTGDTSEMLPEDNEAEGQTDVTPLTSGPPTYGLTSGGLATAVSGGPGRGGHLQRSWQWYRCEADGSDCEPIATATGITYQTTTADRDHNLRVRETLTNGAGAAFADSGITTLPDTMILTGPPTVTRLPATFEFAGTLPGSSYECRLDDSTTWIACASPLTLTGLADGTHTLRVRAVYGGLSDTTPATHTWTVDTTTNVAITNPASGPTNKISPALTFTGEPGASWELLVEGVMIDHGTFDASGAVTGWNGWGLQVGDNVIRVEVTDAAGNTAHDEITLHFDPFPPVKPTPGTGPPPATSDPHAEVTFDVEPGTNPECRLDGGPWLPCTSPWTGGPLPDGDHVLEIRSVDDAGNEGEPLIHEWTVDTEAPPEIEWGGVPSPTSSDPSPTLTFTGEPGSQAYCRIDDGPWEPCSSPFTVPTLGDGPHKVAVKIVDPAGNESPVVEHGWTVDTAPPPAPTVLSGPDPSTTSPDATFTLAPAPGASLECSLDGAPFGPCPTTLALSGLGLGEHVLRLRQTDAAGNVSPVAEHRWTVVPLAIVPPAGDAKVASTKVATQTTVTASKGTVRVGCALDKGVLERCVVKIYERKSNGKRGALLGTGTVRVTADGRSGTTDVKLNARGRRVVARSLGGRRVIVSSVATARDGKTLRAKDVRTTLYPQRLLTIPTVLPFSIDRGVVTGAARRVVADVAPQLRRAKSVRCIGFTDSDGSAKHNRALGLRRAKAVCRTLRQMGVRAKLTSSSRGEDQPRASNETAAGRAKNRRVELVVGY
jgi:outer membrane protein OmpA-like peptidoglycan-associated protein